MRKIALIVAITACFSSSAFAISGVPSTGTEVNQGETSGDGSSQTDKDTYNDNHTDAETTTDTVGWSEDEQATTSLKKMGEARKSHELSVTMQASTILAEDIIEYERNPSMLDKFPKKNLVNIIRAGNYSNPTLGADIGITTVIAPGQVDEVLANVYRHAGSYNIPIDNIAGLDVGLARKKLEELIVLGAINGQAILNATNSLALLEPKLAAVDKIKKTAQKKGIHKALVTVTDKDIEYIGAGDMRGLFKASLNKVLIDGIIDTDIRKTMNAALDDVRNKECRLFGSAESITCGSVQWKLNTIPNVTVGPISWTGTTFAGLEASYRISASWSYSEMIDKMKSINSTSRTAHDFAKKAEDSIAVGSGVDFVVDSKTGAEAGLRATSGVNAGK